MQSMRMVALCFCACLLPTVLAAQSVSVELTRPRYTYYLGYNPQTGQNNLEQNILYMYPDPQKFGNGPYPLAVWTPGTLASFRDPMSFAMVRLMSERGFVGASVQYSNTNVVQICQEYRLRAESVFLIARPKSAVGVLCSLSGIACGAGVVAYGMSQGAALAVMSKNYMPNVAAVYAMSISDFNMGGGVGSGVSLSDCLDKQNTSIPADRLTVVNGESDVFFGGQTPLMNVSGYECPAGAFQCWSPSGSGAGWYIVQDTQVEDGDADHCYPIYGSCTAPTRFDLNWFPESTHDWSLKPNLDWLASFGTRRIFSTSGR